MTSLSAAVMAHESRARSARRIADALGGVPIVTDPRPGPGTSLRTALLAWNAVADGATHHLVAQDDIVVSPQLLGRIQAGIELFPDAALAFYANAHAHNGAAVRLAAAAGASWVEGVHEFYFPTQATALPVQHIPGYVRWASQFTDLWEADDRTLGRYLIAEDIPTLLSVPAFVQHDDLPTIIGTPPRGILKAAATPPDPDDDTPIHDSLASGFEFCPNLYEGQLEVLVRTGFAGRRGWMKGHWPTVLNSLGIPEEDSLCDARPDFRGLYNAIEPRFVDGVWDTAFAIGVLRGQGRIPVTHLRGVPDRARIETVRADALLMMVLGGNRGTPVTPTELARRATDLSELLDRAFTAGTECGARYVSHNIMSGA